MLLCYDSVSSELVSENVHPMKDVTLNQRDQVRLHLLSSVLKYQAPIAQAADLLGGEPTIRPPDTSRFSPGWRRRPHPRQPCRCPRNATAAASAAAVVELAAGCYQWANHTHATEVLRDREGIELSRPTVRRIPARAGIGSPRNRRSRQHRFRRQRMPQTGMLVQLDGSHQAWLEDQGPKFVLLLAVEHATGAVANAVFRTGEDTRVCFMLLEGLICQRRRRSDPRSLSLSRDSVSLKGKGKCHSERLAG